MPQGPENCSPPDLDDSIQFKIKGTGKTIRHSCYSFLFYFFFFFFLIFLHAQVCRPVVGLHGFMTFFSPPFIQAYKAKRELGGKKSLS